jgi:hypothetical protein
MPIPPELQAGQPLATSGVFHKMDRQAPHSVGLLLRICTIPLVASCDVLATQLAEVMLGYYTFSLNIKVR